MLILGYPQGKKGWLLYDLENKRFLVSRDAHFYETIFPFAENSSHSSDLVQQCGTTTQSNAMFPGHDEWAVLKIASPLCLDLDQD